MPLPETGFCLTALSSAALVELFPQLGTAQEKTASRRQRGLGSRFKEDTSDLGKTSLALGLVSRDTARVSQQAGRHVT